jgi:hypothetical protein
MKAFTVIWGWQGESTKAECTEPSVVEKTPWALVWALSGERLTVAVQGLEGQPEPAVVVVNASQTGQNISYVYEMKNFYLEIEAGVVGWSSWWRLTDSLRCVPGFVRKTWFEGLG